MKACPLFFLLFSLLFTRPQMASEGRTLDFTAKKGWEDFTGSFKYILKGSYLQFTSYPSLAYLGLGTGALSYSFDRDQRVFRENKDKKMPLSSFWDGLAVTTSFPILSLSFYSAAYLYDNPKLLDFSKELFASTYLAMGESGLISFIDIHERPNTENLSFWEKSFRGKSSWPSGHVIPMAVLAFKTFQFYGPLYSVAPVIATYFVAKERVRSGKHYLSDVVGGVVLSALASEGVRVAAKSKYNHPLYKAYFEYGLRVSITRKKTYIGMSKSF